LFGCTSKVVGGSLHLRLELMYDLFECSTVWLYHFGKVCWGVGFWFLVCFFSSKVNTVVGVGIASIVSFTVAFGIGIGDSVVYSNGVPGAGDSSCCKAGAGSSSSGIGCGGCILEVAGGVVVGIVIAWISFFKGSLYEVWVEILEDVISLHEGSVDS